MISWKDGAIIDNDDIDLKINTMIMRLRMPFKILKEMMNHISVNFLKEIDADLIKFTPGELSFNYVSGYADDTTSISPVFKHLYARDEYEREHVKMGNNLGQCSAVQLLENEATRTYSYLELANPVNTYQLMKELFMGEGNIRKKYLSAMSEYAGDDSASAYFSTFCFWTKLDTLKNDNNSFISLYDVENLSRRSFI